MLKQIILTISFIILLLLNFTATAAKKKDAINKEDPLMNYEDMAIAGDWKLYMDKCGKKKHKQFLKDLARLSWPDYKTYMAAAAKYTSGGFYTDNCDNKDTQLLYDYYDWIISELTYLTGSSESLDDQITETKGGNTTSEVDSIDDIEEKLKKLKQLYDDGLISLTDYEDKKDEILDSF